MNMLQATATASKRQRVKTIGDAILSPNDAGLVLHKFITEEISVLVHFVSADGFIVSKFCGFVQSFTQAKGLVIGTESRLPKPERLTAWMSFSHDSVVASGFTYVAETKKAEPSVIGSGLRINFPNGDCLTIIEIKE